MSDQHLDELDLRQLSKRIAEIFKVNKRFLLYILVGIMLLSSAYFIKVVLNPKYQSEVFLKTKFVKIEQLEVMFKKYNSYINAPNTNPISGILGGFLSKANITGFEIIEVNIDPKDKDLKFRLYKLKTEFSEKPNQYAEPAIDSVIADIQSFIGNDNEIIENKKRLREGILETDSLIKIAFNAGNNMKNRIQENGQMLVMSDIYNSISGILSKKEGYQIELAFYKNENLIYKSSPNLISKTINTPVIIFVISFLVWLAFCGVFCIIKLIFGESTN
jgi:hypothetical protein